MTRADKPVVLVVDDEPAVRRTLCAILAFCGYEPRPFGGGAAAVESLRQDPGRAVAAVVDVRMPAMDGPATVAAFRAIAPSLPCVFLTGDAGEYTLEHLRACGACAVLEKPIRVSELGEVMGKAITRAAEDPVK
jgi:FixJ family two-component response regulator